MCFKYSESSKSKKEALETNNRKEVEEFKADCIKLMVKSLTSPKGIKTIRELSKR